MTGKTSSQRRRRDGKTAYRSRLDQIMDFAAGAVLTVVDDPDDPDAAGASLELYVKEQPRGEGYVCDFVYSDPKLPLTICGVLLRTATGLIIGELELFRAQWGYFNDYGEFVGSDGDWRAKDDATWDVSARSEELLRRPAFEGVTGALLRTVPIGRILAWAHQAMADDEWRERGLTTVGMAGVQKVPLSELPPEVRAVLERTAAVPSQRRGRPPLADELLEAVALAYLEEAKRGRGLTRRLATRFDRPEETVRDWIHACRVRGYLSPGATGRRGAQPGDRLLMNGTTKESDR